MKPRLLDLFAGAGGAAKGYQNAGFYVVGVDIKPQPRYCGDEFYQADAMTFPLKGFDAIHASPPCQEYSMSALPWRRKGNRYPDLLAPTRERLQNSGTQWIVENVPGAPMRADFILCGSQFGLQLVRHRFFEVSWTPNCLVPACSHSSNAITVTGNGTPSYVRESKGLTSDRGYAQWCRKAMGIDWMRRSELSQAIPPAYTEFIGTQLLRYLQEAK